MSIFNHNLRFLCKKMGLSQQKLADLVGEKRGKVAGYFYNTQSKSDFHQKLISHFHIDLGKFLTLEMTDLNYNSFFTTIGEESSVLKEPEEHYVGKSNIIDLLLKVKQASTTDERDLLIDLIIGQCGRLISENSELKDQLMEALKKE